MILLDTHIWFWWINKDHLNLSEIRRVQMSQNDHLKTLKTIQAHPHLSQRELAVKLGVSLGKANYCMRALMKKRADQVRKF